MKPIEFEIIRQFKEASAENPFTLDKLRQWWAEYTGLNIEGVGPTGLQYTIQHLLRMALSVMDHKEIEVFILILRKDLNYRYMWTGAPFLERETDDFHLILLSRIMSAFILTEVNKLPGYSEFLKKKEDEKTQKIIDSIEKADQIKIRKNGRAPYDVTCEVCSDKSMFVEAICDGDSDVAFGLDDLSNAQIGQNGIIILGLYTLTLYTLTPMSL